MRIRFWGVRGTIPTPGPETVRLGGNTACIDVLTSEGQLIIIDAGSGIRRLGRRLLEENQDHISGTILISHTHWDHIQGFPFFAPLVGPKSNKNQFVVCGQKRVGQQLESVLAGQIVEPYLPFAFRELSAEISVHEMEDGERISLSENTGIGVAELRHPGGCLGFRIEDEDRIFTYCTDSSHEDGKLTDSVLNLANGADLLVHDAQYTLAQRAKFPNYGHSSWLEAAEVAREAGVDYLALFHYDPDASDNDLVEVLGEAQKIFPRTFLSREGLEIHLPISSDMLK